MGVWRSAGQTLSKREEEPLLLCVVFPIRYIVCFSPKMRSTRSFPMCAPGMSSPVDRLEREEERREGKEGEVRASFQD